MITANLSDEIFVDNIDNFVTWDDKSLQQWDHNSKTNETVVNFKFKYPNYQQNVSNLFLILIYNI